MSNRETTRTPGTRDYRALLNPKNILDQAQEELIELLDIEIWPNDAVTIMYGGERVHAQPTTVNFVPGLAILADGHFQFFPIPQMDRNFITRRLLEKPKSVWTVNPHSRNGRHTD